MHISGPRSILSGPFSRRAIYLPGLECTGGAAVPLCAAMRNVSESLDEANFLAALPLLERPPRLVGCLFGSGGGKRHLLLPEQS
jgi:hypothetical protein